METVTEIGRGISEFGFMVVCSGICLICSAMILFLFIKWFVRIIDNIIERQQTILDEILQLQREQKEMLKQLINN
jgi:hypothetical protein